MNLMTMLKTNKGKPEMVNSTRFILKLAGHTSVLFQKIEQLTLRYAAINCALALCCTVSDAAASIPPKGNPAVDASLFTHDKSVAKLVSDRDGELETAAEHTSGHTKLVTEKEPIKPAILTDAVEERGVTVLLAEPEPKKATLLVGVPEATKNPVLYIEPEYAPPAVLYIEPENERIKSEEDALKNKRAVRLLEEPDPDDVDHAALVLDPEEVYTLPPLNCIEAPNPLLHIEKKTINPVKIPAIKTNTKPSKKKKGKKKKK
jgi:hypothetical protein